ncbi:hypothetical protein D3C85_528270 [compost metagenome]
MLDAPYAFLLGARERAGFVAEKFAFDDAFWQGAAVDRDQRAMPAAAEAMQGGGDDFLAGARLPLHQHIDIGVCNVAQGLFDALHGGSGTDEGHFIRLEGEGRFTQTAVFEHQMALFRGMGNGRDQPVGRIGLG